MPPDEAEIIEFPAVIVDVASQTIEANCRHLCKVRPRKSPAKHLTEDRAWWQNVTSPLTSFCTKLTGIEASDLASAKELGELRLCPSQICDGAGFFSPSKRSLLGLCEDCNRASCHLQAK